MKYIFKNRETGKYAYNGKNDDTYDINKAYCFISDEDVEFVNMMVSLNSIYPFYYDTILFEDELKKVRKNKLNHFL